MEFNVIVIGSGAAGYAAAYRLLSFGVENIALVTNGKNFGTSRNTGSDKQTYYKISLDKANDSVYKMACDIASGGSCDGELAFIEAQNSARCFFNLVESGVDFPVDAYGAYAGYKTDHDDSTRATSIGPYTSKVMVEKLEARVISNKELTLLDNRQVYSVLTNDGAVEGIDVFNTETKKAERIYAPFVIAATGAPAYLYRDSVYPASQQGMTGALIKAGVSLVNFAEWQYGIASTEPRWNMSGSYMQVIPDIYSVDENGKKYYFLQEQFNSANELCSTVFKKGYEWPFSAERIGSTSFIDILVKRETDRNRKVFLDYRQNMSCYDFSGLSDEAKNYLIKADAVAETPVLRLGKLNPLALELFRSKGKDLFEVPIEIKVCAQHNNGGVKVNTDFESDVKGLFVIGEAGGVFGLTRQGGTALNDTQVGALRAAQRIAKGIKNVKRSKRTEDEPSLPDFNVGPGCAEDLRSLLSECAAFERDSEKIKQLLEKTEKTLEGEITAPDMSEYLYTSDMLVCAKALLISIAETMDKAGSRGGAVFYKNGKMVSEDKAYRSLRAVYRDGKITFEKCSPVPYPEINFEKLLKSGH